MTDIDLIAQRIRIPATPSELAAMTGSSLRCVRANLYTLRKRNRARKLDRTIRTTQKRGPGESLWEAA